MRGRPKQQPIAEKPRIFERRYTNLDGTTEVWKFNLDKFERGPVEVIINYPPGMLNKKRKKRK